MAKYIITATLIVLTIVLFAATAGLKRRIKKMTKGGENNV